MENIKNQMVNFYNDEVKLNADKVSELREKKKLNIQRLKEGINKYNEENRTNYKLYETIEQGSIAMNTAINPEYDDFDIDVAVVFEKDNIPSDTESVKNLILNFLVPYKHLFKKHPQKKSNCIRIEYQENYHIDLAPYRTSDNFYEHGGDDWTERDPRSITCWFHKQNKKFNNKLKEITRLIKFFTKSRKEWDICGGLIITVLVNEQLEEIDSPENLDIDDLLLQVIEKIIKRIKFKTSILNPCNYQELIVTDSHKQKVLNLAEKLSLYADDLKNSYILSDEKKALINWNKFFKTTYFEIEDKKSSIECDNNEMFIENIYASSLNSNNNSIKLKCKRYISKNGFRTSTQVNCLSGEPFNLSEMKEEKLCFYIETNISQPYTILWKIKNNGPYAKEKNMLRGEICHGNSIDNPSENVNSSQRFESINFEGDHYVECYVIKNNICIARDRFDVKITEK